MNAFARLTAALADRYRLERELGAGGMATVYLAEDLRHHRRVAVKVLRPELAAVIGADRFLAEIRTTANLQHPHILPLFDSGEADSYLFYVMPWVEGESLRDRLTRDKQLPVADAVRIASEVASALDYAHRHGVIHRDIKPENVMLHDGQSLVADFGIALAASSAGTRMTETGMSLGTPQYMSPEQAMGERDLDARSDVYALGCVTYEMLVGEPPFTGATAQAIVAKVMTAEPAPIATQRRAVPAHVEDAVLTALEKLPADRYATAAQFAERLRGEAVGQSSRRATATTIAVKRRRQGALVAVVAALALLGGWLAARLTATSSPAGATMPPSRLAMLLPTLGGSGAGSLFRQVSMTPDGSGIVFVSGTTAGSPGAISLQRLDAEVSSIIAAAGVSYAPEVSPDGEWLAVRNAVGEVTVVPMSPGRNQPNPTERGYAQYAWHPDGHLWFSVVPHRRLMRIAPGGGAAELMLDSLPREVLLQQVLDDGHTALVIENLIGTPTGPLSLLDLATGALTPLLAIPINMARSTAGLLVYAGTDGILLARTFDPARHDVGAVATTIATGVSVSASGEVQFGVATNGTLIYVPEEPRSLVRVRRDGTEQRVTEVGGNFHMPRFAPDGQRLSLDFTTTEGRDVWIHDFTQQTLTRVTFDRDGHDATWMPDGQRMTYASSRSGVYGIYRIRPGGGTVAESLLASDRLNFTGDWFPDGRTMLTVTRELAPGSGLDLVVLRNGGSGPIEPLVASRFNESYPALSPDGRWLAFVSDQSGRREVYVRSIEELGSQLQVSQGGGEEPAWTRDGRELFYRATADGRATLTIAAIATTPFLRITRRTPHFRMDDYLATTPHANYDIAPDGQSIIVIKRSPASRIVVVQNVRALVTRALAQ